MKKIKKIKKRDPGILQNQICQIRFRRFPGPRFFNSFNSFNSFELFLILLNYFGDFVQTVQHFCFLGSQKCCTVCTLRQFSADSTALLLPGVTKVLYCLQKIACMRRQYSTFATPRSKSAVLSAL